MRTKVDLLASLAPSKNHVYLHIPQFKRINNRKLSLLLCIGAALCLSFVLLSGFMLMQHANEADFQLKNQAISLAHPFGTDWMGRDMFVRTLAGLATSLGIGLVAAGASACIALVVGTVAALSNKFVDAAFGWVVDLLLAIPHIVLLILISVALGKGFWGVVLGVAVTHWPMLSRVIRAEVLSCKQAHFVSMARHLGQSRFQIAIRHIVPYVLPQFLIGMVLLFPHAILHEAAITFLGFGLTPETPAIGVILSESMTYLSAGIWWAALFPGLALLGCVLLFEMLGSALRNLNDPHEAQR